LVNSNTWGSSGGDTGLRFMVVGEIAVTVMYTVGR
jgi:hypothetical protein